MKKKQDIEPSADKAEPDAVSPVGESRLVPDAPVALQPAAEARPAGWIMHLRSLLTAVQAERERLSSGAAAALDLVFETLQSTLVGASAAREGGYSVTSTAADALREILGHDPRILLVGTTACDLESLFESLHTDEAGFRLTLVRDPEGARRLLDARPFDLIVYEYGVPDLSEFDAFTALQSRPLCPPVIFVAGDGSEKLAAAAFKSGVYDYVPRREMSAHVLRRTIAQALRRFRLERELEAANQRLAELVNRDPLTGLHNRRYFEGRLAVEFARAQRFSHPLALVLLDIDHFKRINDTYGHATGDRVLIEAARAMLAMARQIDLVARIGGEEFALLLPNTRPDGAHAMAERVLMQVRAIAVSAPKGEVRITLSAGVAAYPDCSAQTRMQLFECADRALYAAKHAGRDRIARYDSEKEV